MPTIGSVAWVAALDAAVRAVPGDDRLVVQHELTDGSEAWYVVVGEGARGGRHPSPDVTFSLDRATAEAINGGALSAQAAFMDGRLRVRGAIGRLADVVDAFARIEAVRA